MNTEDDDLSVWDIAANDIEAENKEKPNSSSLFLKLEKDNTYTVRLIAPPECYRLHWQAFKSIQRAPVCSPAFRSAEKDKDVAWSKGGWEPSKRFSAPVINRDLGRIQILDAGGDVFNPIFALYTSTKKKAAEGKGKLIDPAGEPAPDWVIEVKSKPVKTKNGEKERLVTTCQPDVTSGMNYFSDEEKALIEKFDYDWRKNYAKKSPDEIEEMWLSLPEDKRYHPNRQKQMAIANPKKHEASSAPKEDAHKEAFANNNDSHYDNDENDCEDDDAATLF